MRLWTISQGKNKAQECLKLSALTAEAAIMNTKKNTLLGCQELCLQREPQFVASVVSHICGKYK